MPGFEFPEKLKVNKPGSKNPVLIALHRGGTYWELRSKTQ